MADCMDFPKTTDEFIDFYKFTDTKEYYTNGSELIQVFRVKQMLEHYMPKNGRYVDRAGVPIEKGETSCVFICSVCKTELVYDEWLSTDDFHSNYCPNCGAKIEGDDNGHGTLV